jgi:Putative transposase/Transposase zinc-binding domain
MTRPRLEVADVIRSCYDAFLEQYGPGLTSEQRRALDDLTRCRTTALGGHVLECQQCGCQQISYNSCRNRNCPKCQATASARWLERQAADLLPVPYFHVVFTLPNALDPIALANPRVVYDLLLRTAAQTLLEVAANPDNLGAQLGILTVLHTWGQTLQLHPHVHCVVPGGGLTPDDARWIGCPHNFFLPIQVLSEVFRGKFLAGLRNAFAQGKLRFPGKLAGFTSAHLFEAFLSRSARTKWVVNVRPPFATPERVLKYLARYTHRVAISNTRLLDLNDGQVTFRYKDYAHGGAWRIMTLSAIEFVRRFVMHVLPTGFVRIRHYGLLSHNQRLRKLALCRKLLSETCPPESNTAPPTTEPKETLEVTPTKVCPVCGARRMAVIAEFAPGAMAPEILQGTLLPLIVDTS